MPRDETKRTLGGEIKKICCPYLDIIILASPTMHGEELKYITEAYETNWMSTVGKNINEVEKICISSSVFPKNRKVKFPTLGMGYSKISAGDIFI